MDNQGQNTSPDNDPALKYQLEFLKLEFGVINESIGRIDATTQGTKNWAVIIWAGSLGIALGKTELRPYIPLTAILPLLFWYIDAQWRRIQRSFIFRIRRISEFLNGPGLAQAVSTGRLTDFTVLDPRATKDRDTDEYRNFTSIRRTLRFKEVGPFYLGLVGISIITALLLH